MKVAILVAEFTEKRRVGEGWINGGFLVFEQGVDDCLEGDDASLEADALDMVQHIMRLMEVNMTPDVRAEATNEIRRQCLSAAKARRMLNWKPVYSLDEGLRNTIAWYREFLRSSR